MFQAYESIPGRHVLHVEGSASTGKTGDERKGITTNIINHQNNSGLSGNLQDPTSQLIAAMSNSRLLEILVTEDSTNVPSLSGENKLVHGW